jgi:hypothetical protein
MFPDGRRQRAYLWYARYSELKKIQFWQSVVDDVDRLQFRRDPTPRLGRLTQELRQIEHELGRDFLREMASQEHWSGMLPDWMTAPSTGAMSTSPVRPAQLPASIVPTSAPAAVESEPILAPPVFPQPRELPQSMAFSPATCSQPPSIPQVAGFPSPFGFPPQTAPPVRTRPGRPS